MAVELVKPVTPAEIKSIMFGINGEKALGPDGYTSQFFKVAWNVVGEDVTQAVEYFFHTSKLLPAFNSTIVALVPKCHNPCNINNCNFLLLCDLQMYYKNHG